MLWSLEYSLLKSNKKMILVLLLYLQQERENDLHQEGGESLFVCYANLAFHHQEQHAARSKSIKGGKMTSAFFIRTSRLMLEFRACRKEES